MEVSQAVVVTMQELPMANLAHKSPEASCLEYLRHPVNRQGYAPSTAGRLVACNRVDGVESNLLLPLQASIVRSTR